MSNQQFVHLHLHSEYSLVNGMLRLKSLVKACRERNLPAVALTDRCNLFGTVKFYRAALKAGIKPIIGAEMLIKNPDDAFNPFSLILLCQNQAGYRQLTALISRAYLEGQQHGIPLIEREWIDCKDVIALSGGKKGDIGQAILQNNLEQAARYISFWNERFPSRFYLEIQRTQRQGDEQYNAACLQLANAHQIPVVATNEVMFLDQNDYEAHEARVCIHNGEMLQDPKRQQNYSEQQYLRSAEEMQNLFADIPEALTNSLEIAKRCNLQLELDKNYLPNFPVPAGFTIENYLENLAKEKLELRLKKLFDSQQPQFLQQRQAYDERLARELNVINAMGFPGYFLIVADFIQWSKDNGIPVGPGRGSGAGSLVAYSLGITDIDPLAYDLLFERFLNPERVSMPDFDIDFCMDNRDRVIDYVAQKYGRESVSQIITFGTMAAKAVVRDVGRVLGFPYGFVDKIAKLVPFELGITLEKALSQEPLLRERYEREEDVQTLIDLALKLEGITRNAGKHAGGVVIAPSKLINFVPLYCEEGGGNLVSQFDKDDVEGIGLVKFDFLGLRTLTIIDWAIANIQKHFNQKIDITTIPTDDAVTFDLLKRCETTAVFQLESRGMKDLIKRLQPDCFEDIIALVALFRPGPLQSGMVDDFIDRKHGRQTLEYMHEDLTEVLKPTYGIILYQEQVMQIAQVLAGYTLGGADLLRRAMGKKKPEEMAKQRQIFVEGASARGVDAEQAQHIFDLMEKFAGYGFNKSHSAAYALVSYQTAWLKAHYPAAFMAAVLSSDMDNTDKVVMFIEECQRMQLTIIYPHINHSQYQFSVRDNSTIVYGLGAIKGLGQAIADVIVAEREKHGEYRDIVDLCLRLNQHKLNRRVLEALVRSGSADHPQYHRVQLFTIIDSALLAATQSLQAEKSGQQDLFSALSPQAMPVVEFPEIKPWSEQMRLQGEKETLGLYVSGHPLDEFRQELAHFTTSTIKELASKNNQSVILAGFMITIRTLLNKRGERMGFMTLDDGTARIEVAIFSDAFQLYRELIVKDNLMIIEGELSIDDFSGNYRMSAKRILSLEQAREAYAKYLLLNLKSTHLTAEFSERLKDILRTFSPGATPVVVNYQESEFSARLVFGKQWTIQPRVNLINELNELIGAENIAFSYE
ncbi:MAG: DNA polymerase III subunit alpha [Legionellales bacterium]|nr:DNA polymerase III subunit alpha [Legionellales bacterium]